MTGIYSPLVSILIPCYNAEQWVGQAIESALAQTWRDKEVLVVDDGSTDGSLEIIRSHGDRIRFESGPNRGANVARNRLLELSHGEWLQYLDADDYLLDDKISGQLASVPNRNSADVIFSPMTMEYWQDGRPVRERLLCSPFPNPRRSVGSSGRDGHCPARMPSSSAARRSSMRAAGSPTSRVARSTTCFCDCSCLGSGSPTPPGGEPSIAIGARQRSRNAIRRAPSPIACRS